VPIDYQSKRVKADPPKSGHPGWRPLHAQETTNAISSPSHSTVSRTPEVEGSFVDTANVRTATPPRQPTYTQLIEDALEAHPEGLDTRGISNWLKIHRREAVDERGEKFDGSLQSALSAQANKKNRTIWKCPDRDNGKDIGPVIWSLWKDGKRADGQSMLPSGTDSGETPAHERHEPTEGTMRVSSGRFTPGSRHTDSPRGTDLERIHRGERPTVPSRFLNQDTSGVGRDEAVGGEGAQVRQRVKDGAGNQSQLAHIEIGPASSERAANGHSDTSTKQNEETPLRYGNLVLEIQSLKESRNTISGEIEEKRKILPSVDTLEANVKHKLEQAQELEQKAAEARAEAGRAVQDRDSGIQQATDFTARERELEKVVQLLSEKRRALDID